MKEIKTTIAQALSQNKIKLFISAGENWDVEFSGVNYAELFSLEDIASAAGFDCWSDFMSTATFDQIEKSMNEKYHESANSNPIPASNNKEKPRVNGYIYLMRNERNGYTKIGFSKNPEFREKTLQSEEPEINLIYKSKGDINDERLLHEKYCSSRVRGEWFDLSESDINDIKGSMAMELSK